MNRNSEHDLLNKIAQLENENQRLKEQNNELNTQLQLFQFIDDVIIVYDNEGNYLHFSTPKNNLEYKPFNQILNKNIFEVLPKTLAQKIYNAIKKVLSTNSLVTLSYSLEVEGQKIWYDARIKPYKNNSVLFVARNISSYKEKEQFLINSELKLKAIFNNTIHAFVILNKEHKIEIYNKRLKQLVRKLLGKEGTIESFINALEQKNPGIKAGIQQAFSGNESSLEINLNRLWFSVSFTPVKDDNKILFGIFINFRDITKHKASEKRLLKSKANLKAMFDSSQRLYHLIDPSFKIISFNKLASEYFKNVHNINLVEGTNILKYIPPLKKNKFQQSIIKALKGEKVSTEGWFFEKGKAIYWAESLFMPVYNNKNEIFGVAYSVLNINEKHNFITKIEENEAKYRSLVENLPLTTYLSEFSNINNIYYISPKIEELTGFNYERFILEENLFSSLITDNDKEIIKQRNNLFLNKSTKLSLEYRIKNSREQIIWIREESHLILDSKNEPKYIQGVLIDISKRKENEQLILKSKNEIVHKNEELSALNEELKATNEELKNNQIVIENSKDAFQKIFEQSPDAIIIVNQRGYIIDCNDETQELVQTRKAELIGKSAFSFINNYEREKIINAFRESYLNRIIKDLEVTVVTKNNENLFVEFSLSSIKGRETNDLHYIIILKDVTTRKKTLLALKKSEQNLKETNIAKDKFFSIIAHDLKNPFNNIMGFSELLMSDIENYSSEKINEILAWINESSVQGYNLLENLLNWSRSQTGRLTWNPESVDLIKLINIEGDLLKKTAKKKGIKLIIPDKGRQMIFADKNMIKTVIRNLVSNAIKFTAKTGKVSVLIEEEKQKNSVKISVKDTGIGISAKAQKEIFRIDKQSSTPGTENESGTGLGLILCKEFIELNGGSLKLKSKTGHGSTFYFTLPTVEVLNN